MAGDLGGDSPEAIALCDALDEFIGACIEDGVAGNDSVERTYLDLVAKCKKVGDNLFLMQFHAITGKIKS